MGVKFHKFKNIFENAIFKKEKKEQEPLIILLLYLKGEPKTSIIDPSKSIKNRPLSLSTHPDAKNGKPTPFSSIFLYTLTHNFLLLFLFLLLSIPSPNCMLGYVMAIPAALAILPLGLLFILSGLVVNLIQVFLSFTFIYTLPLFPFPFPFVYFGLFRFMGLVYFLWFIVFLILVDVMIKINEVILHCMKNLFNLVIPIGISNN